MTVILVPNTAQFKVYGTVGGNPWVNIIHFQISMASGPITAAVLNAMCNKWQSDLEPRVSLDWPASHILQGVSAVDLSVNAPALGQSTGGAMPGSATGMQDASACLLVNFKTGVRYRGGHGRMYLPGLVTGQQQNATQWATSSVTTWQTSINTTISDTISAGITAGASAIAQVIPMYTYTVTDDTTRKKYIRTKSAWKENAAVYSAVVSQQIRSQRRRLGAA